MLAGRNYQTFIFDHNRMITRRVCGCSTVHWCGGRMCRLRDVEDLNMNKRTAYLAALLAAALTAAMPLSANAQVAIGNAPRAAPAIRAPGGFHPGAVRSFHPGAVRSFHPGAVRSFNPGARMAVPHFSPNRSFSTRQFRSPTFSTRRFSSPTFTRRGRVPRFTTRTRTFRTFTNRRIQRQLVQPRGTNLRALRTTRANRLITPLARQGRFSSHFATTHSGNHWLHAHRAWRRGHRAAFVGWYGPIFWPYAYSDIFDYTFWPYGYDDAYWFYAYDDFFDGIFWGGYGPDYAYAPSGAPSGRTAPRVRAAAIEELCQEPGTGITAWPFADIERKVNLNGDQKQLLGDLRDAANQAKSAFKASCPSAGAFALTPPGRLDAMTARLDATLKAVEIVRPPLEKFYTSLSDEQKERFNELGPSKQVSAEARAALPDQGKTCGEAKPGLTNLPIEQIQAAVKPDKEQQANLDKLGEATVKAVGILQAACPDATPLTPTGRLEAMEKRLQAMIEAANTVKEPLNSFYSSLSNEQKARFNRMGRELAQSND
jgi:hypothetical protein